MEQDKRGPGWPDGPDDVINKHGEYEVQANNGTENDYPQIAQGLAEETKQELRLKEALWRTRM